MARVVCHVQPAAAGVSLTWADGPAAFAPYELSAKALAAAADAARAALGGVVECFFSDDAGDAPAATAALAAAGFGLYQALFKTPAEQQALATDVRKWLDKLQGEDAVETVEVVAEGGVAVPWNLVYDRRPDPAAFKAGGDDPARWRPFWGLRYDLAGGRRVSPLRRLPVLHNPRVVVVTDPLVIDRLVAEARELAALCQEHGWTQASTRQELADALQGGRPDLLYWLGHTQTDPFGLVLGDDVITPDDLKTLMEGDPFADAGGAFGGVAFLNACGTAGGGPGGSFLDALHPLGLSGYVATEQVTVDTFAAPLGREFLAAFAAGGEPLGRVMRRLRGRVPLGLLYGSYCPSAIHVRREPPAAPADAAPIVLTHAGVGTKLRRSPDEPRAAGHPLPAQPYRSLQAYGPADRALFAGRDDDTLRFAQLLDEPGTRLVLLHGESGVGKTSFLRAGVIPFLETECVGYRFARDRVRADGDAVLLVRATNDPVAQVAAALTTYCARPLPFRTPLGDECTADLPGVLRAAVGGGDGRDALRDALRNDPGLLGRLLADLGRVLPFTPVLVIDQAEEVFTLARTPADEENRARALEMLRRAAAGPGGFKVVVSLRTEYQGRFTDRLRAGTRPGAGVREYLLTDFGRDALVEVIRRPTSTTPIEHAAEIPAEKYRFRFAPGVAEEIAGRARAFSVNRSDSVLPLVQVICTQLYDRVRARPDAVVALADLEAIGGVEGGMRAHAEALVGRLFPRRADARAFKTLLADPRTQLFIRQSDGTLTTALLPAAFLARHWAGRTPFDDVLRTAAGGDWRLLRVNSLRIGEDAEEQPYVSLGHDALAKVAARWQDERRRRAQVRKYAAAAAVAVAVAAGAFAFQEDAARQKLQLAENEAQLAQTKLKEAERRAKVRGQFAGLFAKADQATSAARIDGIPWENVAAVLGKALEVAKADPDAFADWPLKQSADTLLAKANAALATTSRRKAEREKLAVLGDHHRDAVFFGTLATGLGEAENRARVRTAVADGLAVFGVDPAGGGEPKYDRAFFTPDERRLVSARCYELLLLDAQALAAAAVPEPGKTKSVGEIRAGLTAALGRLDRADRLVDGTKTRSGLTQRAEYLSAFGSWKAAATAAAEAAATSPVLAADYYLIGLERHRRGEFAPAVAPLAAALRAESDHFGAQYLLAVSYLRLDKPQEAKREFEKCVALRPEFVWPKLYLALVEPDAARAAADLDEVVKATAGAAGPDAAVRYVALTSRGVLAYRGRDWATAEDRLKQAIALRPDALPAHVNLALTHKKKADDALLREVGWGFAPGGAAGAAAAAGRRRAVLDEAVGVLDKAVDRLPAASRLYHERGNIHLLREDAEKAGIDILAAVKTGAALGVGSTLADDLIRLGRLKHAAREYRAAATAYGAVVALPEGAVAGEKRALAARLSADALLARDDFEKAGVALDVFFRLTPAPAGEALPEGQRRSLAAALVARGVVHANLEKPLDALDCYTRALAFDRTAEALVLRGSAYLKEGAPGLALTDFDEALWHKGGDPEALLGWAEARVKDGQTRDPDAFPAAVKAAASAAAAAEKEVARVVAARPGDDQKPTRLRLGYLTARVLAQLALAEPSPDVAARHTARAAALLRQARPDVADPDAFWRAVTADPALRRVSTSPAMAAVAAEYGAAGR